MQLAHVLLLSVCMALFLPSLASAAPQDFGTTNIAFDQLRVYPASQAEATDAANGKTYAAGTELKFKVYIIAAPAGYSVSLYLEPKAGGQRILVASRSYDESNDMAFDVTRPENRNRLERESYFTYGIPEGLEGAYYAYAEVRDASGNVAKADGKEVARYWGRPNKFSFSVMKISARAELSPPGTPLAPEGAAKLEPALLEIYVDNEFHERMSDYKDVPGGYFTIGKSYTGLFPMVKMRGAYKGEKLSVYLVPKGETMVQEKFRVCYYTFDNDNNYILRVRIKDCPIPAQGFPEGEYNVYVRHENASFSVLQRGGKPQRFWGGANKDDYFVVLVGKENAEGIVTELEKNNAPAGAVPASIEISYELGVFDPKTKKKSKVPYVWEGDFKKEWLGKDFTLIPNSEYVEGAESRLVYYDFTLRDEDGKGICSARSEREPLGLEGALKDGDCDKSPSYIECAGKGMDKAISMKYCSIGKHEKSGKYKVLFKLSDAERPWDYPKEIGYSRDGAQAEAHAAVNLDAKDLVFNSKKTVGYLRVKLKDDIENFVLLRKLLAPADKCLIASEDLKKVEDKKGEYELAVTYDQMCEVCSDSAIDALSVSSPGKLEATTVKARIPCQADNLVIDLLGARTEKGATVVEDYIADHPLTSRLVYPDSKEQMKQFGFDSEVEEQDVTELARTSEGMAKIIDKLHAVVKPKQLVLLGPVENLPVGKLKSGDKTLDTDDAYGQPDKKGVPKIPVGRIMSLADLVSAGYGLLPWADFPVTRVIGNACETCESGKQFTAFIKTFYKEPTREKAIQEASSSINLAPPDCLQSTGASAKECTRRDAYLSSVLGRGQLYAFITDSTEGAALAVKDAENNEYTLLDKDNVINHVYFRLVFVSGEKNSKVSSVLQYYANSLIVLDGAGSEDALSKIGLALSRWQLPAATKKYSVGEAILKAKKSLATSVKPAVLPSQLVLYGDPAAPLIPEKKPEEKKTK